MDSLNKYIEHTLLKPEAECDEFTKLCNEAVKYKFYGVCVNPRYVKPTKAYLVGTDVKVITVVGFPLGASKSEAKAYETKLAIEDGADEIDMVLNISFLKTNQYEEVEKDIKAVREACQGKILKVIIETDLLTKEQIKKACEICIAAKADFVKTSTGFAKNGVGAKVEDVELMYNIVSTHGLQVKASAGIRNKEQALALIKAGASRLGTSAGVEIISS